MTGSVPVPATSYYLRCPLGVPRSQSFPLYPRREAETPPLPCCQIKFWLCERGYEGSSFSPQDSVGSRMQQRLCQEPSDTSKPEKLGTCLISPSECLVWVAPCRNPAMTLVPGSPLQPLWQPPSKHSSPGGHTQAPGETSRNQRGVSALLAWDIQTPSQNINVKITQECSVNFSTRVGAQHCGLTFKTLFLQVAQWVHFKAVSVGNGHSHLWTFLRTAVAFPLSTVCSLLFLSAKLNPSLSGRNQMFSLCFGWVFSNIAHFTGKGN